MKKPKFHILQDKQGSWRWHLRAANGRILCQGESHTRKSDAERAIEAVKRAIGSIHAL